MLCVRTEVVVMSSDILTHHGVKGMRWGHRKQEHTNATLSKDQGGLSLSSRRFISKLDRDTFSKFAMEYLRETAWDGGERGTATGAYADMLKKHGYSGVNDLNLPESAARVLFDKSAVAIR